MDFKFGEKEEALRKEIGQFVSEQLPPSWLMYALEEESSDHDWAFSMSVSKKLALKGWLTLSWPRRYGGKEASLWEQLVYRDEVGYWGIPGTSMGVGGIDWVGPSIIHFGSNEQKKKYLPLRYQPTKLWQQNEPLVERRKMRFVGSARKDLPGPLPCSSTHSSCWNPFSRGSQQLSWEVLNSLLGVIFGGIFLGVAESLAGGYISVAFKNTLVFLIIVILLVRPEGLLGEMFKERI